MAGSIILGVTFGMEVKPENDPYVLLAEKALQSMAAVGNVGSYMGTPLSATFLDDTDLPVVDYLPWRKYTYGSLRHSDIKCLL